MQASHCPVSPEYSSARELRPCCTRSPLNGRFDRHFSWGERSWGGTLSACARVPIYQVPRITISACALPMSTQPLPMSTQPSMSLRRAVPEAWSRASAMGFDVPEIPPPEELSPCPRT